MQLTIRTGDKKLVRINQWTTGYLSNGEPRTHFGLGQEERINELEIKWPNGEVEVYNNIEPNKYLTIKQGKGIVKQ